MRRNLILFFISLILLQACAGSSTVTPIVEVVNDLPIPMLRTPEPEPTALNMIPSDPAILRGVKVNLWHGWDGESSTLIEKMVSEFNLTNPYGFEIVATSKGNFTKLGEAISKATDSNEMPDLVMALPEQIAAIPDNMADLTPYMDSIDYGMTGVEIPNSFLSQSNFNGAQLGLPMARSARFVYYNLTFASELGYSNPPQTLAEFEEQACAANQSWKTDDDLTNDGFGGFALDTLSNWQTPLSWVLFNSEGFGKELSLVLDTSDNLKTFTFLNNLRTSGCAWFSNSEDNYRNLATRRALMITGDLLEINSQRDAFSIEGSGDNWQLIPFPGQNPGIIVYGADFSIAKKELPQQLASWVFIRWMMQTENQMRWAEDTRLLPVTNAALQVASSSAVFPPQYHQAISLIDVSVGYTQSKDWPVVKNLMADGMFQFNKMYPYITMSDLLKDIDAQSKDLIK